MRVYVSSIITALAVIAILSLAPVIVAQRGQRGAGSGGPDMKAPAPRLPHATYVWSVLAADSGG